MKNVNKQLKSADFFSEMSKFQKSVLTKILSFFIVMSKYTLIFAVLQPNMKYLMFLLSTLCYCRKIEMEIHPMENSIDFTSLMPIVFCINWTTHLTQQLIAKIEIFYKSWRKSVNFFYVTDRNVSLAGHKYN